MPDNYRLIWFQHLQKAAGTSIIQMALHNGETLHPGHINANPYTPDGHLFPLEKMKEQEIIDFVDQCQDLDVTFVATEFAAPSFPVLISDPRVILITSLREPLLRFISHFYFDLYRGGTDVLSPEQFVNSGNLSTMPNYYCRIFSMHNNNPHPIGLEQYDIAVSTLRSFDCCIVLERENPFQGLFRLLEWEKHVLRKNQTRLDFLSAIRYLAKGKLGLLLRRITHPRRKPSDEFTRRFREENYWDYRLYETIRENV